MSRKSLLSKAGFWVSNHLNILELSAVALLFITLVVYNYTRLQYNQLIIIPLIALAIIYYLASFSFSPEKNSNIFEMITSKLVYLFACIGFLGLAFEYVQNPGARIMLMIGGFAELLFFIAIIIAQIIRKASFSGAIIIRTLIFAITFSVIYIIAYGLIV
jgi:hypothetical protein